MPLIEVAFIVIGFGSTQSRLGLAAGAAAAAVVLVVAVGARALAFPISVGTEGAEMSLDSAIFIAATACLGSAAWLSGRYQAWAL